MNDYRKHTLTLTLTLTLILTMEVCKETSNLLDEQDDGGEQRGGQTPLLALCIGRAGGFAGAILSILFLYVYVCIRG